MYAQPTVILICVFIGLFTVVHQLLIYQSSRYISFFSSFGNAKKRARASLTYSCLLLVLSHRRNKPRSTAYYRTLALGRWLAIKQFRIPGWSSVSIGNCLILAGLGLFFLRKFTHEVHSRRWGNYDSNRRAVRTVMTFVPQPFYWPEIGWAHSPPLGTRTGWLALALLPFLM